DIGAAKNTIYEYSLAGNPRIEDELFIVARSEPVPSNGLCIMPTVGKEAIAKLQTALLELDKTAEGRKVLQNLHARKFIETSPADYDPVFDFIENAGITIEPYRSYAQ
ncbi:MAG TPA: hypothetical protein ENO11_02220, partial [Desulfobacteraceae bacterium]|nr:hypothetical protein [Desulfobacteraceae bacterium]